MSASEIVTSCYLIPFHSVTKKIRTVDKFPMQNKAMSVYHKYMFIAHYMLS